MAEFSFLTKYIFGKGIEEIDVNAWNDVEVQYSNGLTKKLDERFDSPAHAINVVRRMLHVSGMVWTTPACHPGAFKQEHPYRGAKDPVGG
jgi:pilus assembly protein CpaF